MKQGPRAGALHAAAAQGLPTLADPGYQGAGIGIHVLFAQLDSSGCTAAPATGAGTAAPAPTPRTQTGPRTSRSGKAP